VSEPDDDIAGLIEAAKQQTAVAEALNATADRLLQSVALLAGSVAQLLEEDMGTQADPEPETKPAPDSLDAD